MTVGELEQAKRRALNILDRWLDVTGVIEINTGYYYEMQSIVDDAVHCGAQAATGDYRRIDGEPDDVPLPPSRPASPRSDADAPEALAQAFAAAANDVALAENATQEAAAVRRLRTAWKAQHACPACGVLVGHDSNCPRNTSPGGPQR